MRNWKKVLDFLATTEALVYYQHCSHTKSKTQQLLGEKLTLSQLKPEHCAIKTPSGSTKGNAKYCIWDRLISSRSTC